MDERKRDRTWRQLKAVHSRAFRHGSRTSSLPRPLRVLVLATGDTHCRAPGTTGAEQRHDPLGSDVTSACLGNAFHHAHWVETNAPRNSRLLARRASVTPVQLVMVASQLARAPRPSNADLESRALRGSARRGSTPPRPHACNTDQPLLRRGRRGESLAGSRARAWAPSVQAK